MTEDLYVVKYVPAHLYYQIDVNFIWKGTKIWKYANNNK